MNCLNRPDCPDAAGMVCDLAYHFFGRYGGDLDDLVQTAALAYCRAVKTHDPAKSPFHRYVKYQIGRELFEQWRTRARRHRLAPREPMPAAVADSRNPFGWVDFVDELSADARAVVEFLMEQGTTNRKRLKFHFRQVCGWTHGRITKTFNEIEGALA